MELYGVLTCILMIIGGSADLHKKLHYFETLKTVNLAARKRRSVDSSFRESKEISFQALGRNFNLVLYPGTSVLSVNFQANTVDRFGRKKPFYVNPNEFFTGHLAEDASVKVAAHFEDGILSSTITFPNETYAIEPAWRHLPPSDNHTMIVYRGSDVKWDELYPTDEQGRKREKLSDGIRLELDEKEKEAAKIMEDQLKQEYGESRVRRSTGRKNLCTLLIVADYLFFKDVGITREGTALYLVGVLNRVNERYKKTVWDGSDMTGYGFQIKEMLIHTEYTDQPGHYNEKVTYWDTRAKLDAFSRDQHLQDFCLAHLYTSYTFDRNVLGLAFIASEMRGHPGGICSTTSGSRKNMIYPNTGWSSALNKAGDKLLTLQFELVNTHEFGHNWGSEHDPDTDECAPSSYKKGKYIMWAFAVTGWEDNNLVFSPCSKRWVAPVLQSKADFCFTEKLTGLCGNGLIDEGEECDAGFFSNAGEDTCCTANCKLKKGAVCSGVNYECCKNCQVATARTSCSASLAFACRKEAVCDGQNLTCPPAMAADDGTPCLEKGKCQDGRCLSFCATQGKAENIDLEPCICDQNSTAACSFCCMVRHENGSFGSCEPTSEKLADGRSCGFGYCQNGECERVTYNLVQRIFKFFISGDISDLVQFMQTNIVGTVLVLSLIIWVPSSWVFSCIDKRARKEQESCRLSQSSRGPSLMPHDLKDFRIKNSRFTRAPQKGANGARGHGFQDESTI